MHRPQCTLFPLRQEGGCIAAKGRKGSPTWDQSVYSFAYGVGSAEGDDLDEDTGGSEMAAVLSARLVPLRSAAKRRRYAAGASKFDPDKARPSKRTAKDEAAKTQG